MRFVIKVGTSLLTNAKHELNRGFLRRFTTEVVHLYRDKHEIIIVTSGAVAAGRQELIFDREKKNIPFRQALAAVGQGLLMKTYHEMFFEKKIIVAQALLTNYDFINRENFLNSKEVFELLLRRGVIPIVNENDVTTIAELKFGDNDMLSAKTAAMVSADNLVILTDVDGFFTHNPKVNRNAKLIPVVSHIDESLLAQAKGSVNSLTLGGMKTKLEAAQYVTSAGISMWIANGKRSGILQKLTDTLRSGNQLSSVLGSPLGTFFPSSTSRLTSQKKWLKPKMLKNAWIEIDEGAKKALLLMGKSLLPSGIVKIHGIFRRGDVIAIKQKAENIGYGQVNYSSMDIDKIKKHRTNEIEKILGFSFEDEVIHRDQMVTFH